MSTESMTTDEAIDFLNEMEGGPGEAVCRVLDLVERLHARIAHMQMRLLQYRCEVDVANAELHRLNRPPVAYPDQRDLDAEASAR